MRLHRTALVALLFALVTGPAVGVEPTAEPDVGARAYAKTVEAEAGLVAWWPLDEDLVDDKGGIVGTAVGGAAEFVPGVGGGRALRLEKGRFVTFGQTPSLDPAETTVELWFQLHYEPTRYNPCLVAKRDDGLHTQTRWSLHAWGDYSCVAVWNGRKVVRFTPVDGPLEPNRWYHLAMTSRQAGGDDAPTKVYLNGVPCSPDVQAAPINAPELNRSLSLGSSQPVGAELTDCTIDSLAIHGRVLDEATLARHVDAMGFRAQREQLVAMHEKRLAEEAALLAEAEKKRAEQRDAFLHAPDLLVPGGEPFVYRDEHLRAISLTLAGIGTGSIQIDGRAMRHVWQIFNNHRPAQVPNSFFAVRVDVGGKSVVRALQTERVGPFAAVDDLSFQGEYPFGWYAFEDDELPVTITMEAYNPLIPLETRDSAIPCAVFNLSATNPTDKPVTVSFLATQQNAVGYRGDKPIDGRAYSGYGGNRNEILTHADATVLSMSSDKPADAPGSGQMALVAMTRPRRPSESVSVEVTAAPSWENLETLHRQFADDGTLDGSSHPEPSPEGQTLDGALCIRMTLKPGERHTVPVVLCWHFPNANHGASAWGGKGNRYATFWPDVLSVVRHLETNLPELEHKTRLYHDTLYESNLPRWLVDRMSSQLAVLRSKTCFWAANGYFGGWEGCCPSRGCCHGNCNHVWHYSQAHGRLFPEIARTMRDQEFFFQADNGAIPHRQPRSFPAFDGQCGAVLNSYREHLMSPDRRWLDANWPAIRRATEHLITQWDADEDGVLTGPQWNTLDGALGGNSSWLGSLYLAALSAAERMALLEAEPDTAERYARIRQSGIEKQDAALFNGEYYIQIPESTPHEDYADGCHIDQVLGQWWSDQLDLGQIYPADRTQTALASLFKYNFRGVMEGLPQVPRKFVADADAGMQMITWPKGPRPARHIRYGDEVMTGFEYPAASAMINAGLMREGMAVVRAIGDRYDGRLRDELTPSDHASWGYSGNPFGDDECGKFYARAMSVWSMLLSMQGYLHDGPAGRIGFRPRWQPNDHVSFFTAAEGWGLLHQQRVDGIQTERIEPRYGRVRISSMVFESPSPIRDITVRQGDRVIPCEYTQTESQVDIKLAEPLELESSDILEVVLTP